jgi:calcineurin-like phosphoesterase family protein
VSIYFTSDLHIGHAKIAAIRFGHDEIPDWWSDYETNRHDQILAQKWDETVGKDEVVYVLGDISSGSSSGQLKALEWLRKRPGRKRLIKGNHDSVHDMYRDAHAWEDKYRKVFESLNLHGRRRITLRPISEGGDGGHVDVLLSHFPYTGDHKPADRHTQWRLRDEGLIILHGHTHSSEKLSYAVTGNATPQIHIGVDAWHGKPVPLDEIQRLVRRLKERP